MEGYLLAQVLDHTSGFAKNNIIIILQKMSEFPSWVKQQLVSLLTVVIQGD
jgi:hypothetical protein